MEPEVNKLLGQVVELTPGRIYVVEIDQVLPTSTLTRLTDRLNRQLEDKRIRFIVLDAGMKIARFIGQGIQDNEHY